MDVGIRSGDHAAGIAVLISGVRKMSNSGQKMPKVRHFMEEYFLTAMG